MREVRRIVEQARRAFEGEAWHGPSLKELLADVDAARAARRPLARAHSIWELVLHLAACKDEARRRLEGEAVELSDEDAFPQVRDPSALAWRAALENLDRAHRELETIARGLDDDRLPGPVPGRGYDVYVLLHGVVQHDLYHAGQIALLKKD